MFPVIRSIETFIYVQIERDTNGMLQCHPYPKEYVDTSKPCPHCAFFMGLQRKEGVRGQEGQQFDIRLTVDEFRLDVNRYGFWKPGMDMYVCHVRRKQLPLFIFPDGYKRPRLSRHGSQQDEVTYEDASGCGSGPTERHIRRKINPKLEDTRPIEIQKQTSISPPRVESVSPESIAARSGGTPHTSFNNGARLDCLATVVADSNSGVGLAGGQLETGSVVSVGLVENVVRESIAGNECTAMFSSELSRVRNEEKPSQQGYEIQPSEHSEKPPSLKELVSPSAESKDTCQIELDGDRVGNVVLVDSKNMETDSDGRILNWTEGTIDVDQELVKPCSQTMGVENAEGVLGSTSGNRNLNCEVSFSI